MISWGGLQKPVSMWCGIAVPALTGLKAVAGVTNLKESVNRFGMSGRSNLDRRSFLQMAGGGAVALSFLRVTPLAATEAAGLEIPEHIRPLLEEAFGGADLRPGRISIDLPIIAETGLSVPITLSVASPMTEGNHVQRIMAFVPGNPEYVCADYLISPATGRAEVSSRIRIARTQSIIAAALMSDGTRWGSAFEITVTRGACVDDIFVPDLEAVEERERRRQENLLNGLGND